MVILGGLLVGVPVWSSMAGQGIQTRSCVAALININLDTITVGFAGAGAPFPEDWRTVDNRHVIEANVELLEAARGAGILIIYLYGSYDRLAEGEVLAEYAEEIAPHDGDLLIGRPGPNQNVFTDTVLLQTLQERGIERLIFSGLNTGYCINQSSRWGLRLGFDVTVAADAHSGGTPEYARSYNEYWPTLGIHVIPSAELDFAALCTSSEPDEQGED